jgi:hypothetical protein
MRLFGFRTAPERVRWLDERMTGRHGGRDTSLTVFGIVGDTQPGLSSTARNSLGWSALLEFITTTPEFPHALAALLFPPISPLIPGADSLRTFLPSLRFPRSLLLLPPRHGN